MDKFLDIVQYWYDRNNDELDYDNRMFYLMELFQELKQADFQKEHLPAVGQRVLSLLNEDFIDESIHMLFQRIVAEEINEAYREVNVRIDEIKDDFEEIQQVKEIDDGDTYVNNTSEPDIDLRDVDLGDIEYDEEYIKELGIKK